MLRSLTAKQFAEWEHYARLEPFSELRQDIRIASIVQMLHNVNVKKGRPLTDFILKFEQEEAQREGARGAGRRVRCPRTRGRSRTGARRRRAAP